MLDTEILYSYAYIAGLFSFFSPCIFPILPVYFSILSTGEKSSVFKTIFFILGLSTAFVLLGFGAGLIGGILSSDYFRIISGVIIIIFGLVQSEILKIPFLERTKVLEIQGDRGGIVGSYLLGFGFSLGWTPCIGPILASILFISGSGEDVVYAGLLMLVYVLGLATPFLIISFSSKYFLSKLSFIKKYLGKIKRVGGVIIILMGVLLIFNQLNIFL